MTHPMTAKNADFRVGIKADNIIRGEADGKIRLRAFDLLWGDARFAVNRIRREANERVKQ